MARFKRVGAGDPISAAQYNLLLDEVERLGRIGVSGPLTLDDGPGGVVIGCNVHQPLMLVKYSSAATGGGKYNMKSWTGGPGAVATTGNAAESDCGTFSSTEDVLGINVREIGKTTHDVTGSYLPLVFLARIVRTNSDGTKVVVFDGMQWEDCT